MDKEGKIIDGIFDLPKNWKNMAETQKQAFRDQKRKELGEKYNISSQERDMPIRAITEPETRVEKSL